MGFPRNQKGAAASYFGSDFLLRRHDHQVDVAGLFPAAGYVDQMVEVQGLKMPTRRRAYIHAAADKVRVSTTANTIGLGVTRSPDISKLWNGLFR